MTKTTNSPACLSCYGDAVAESLWCSHSCRETYLNASAYQGERPYAFLAYGVISRDAIAGTVQLGTWDATDAIAQLCADNERLQGELREALSALEDVAMGADLPGEGQTELEDAIEQVREKVSEYVKEHGVG